MTTAKRPQPCDLCRTRTGSTFREDITMAFQPIFDARTGDVFAQEALVRGTDGRSADDIMRCVTDKNRYHFDQRCRTTAIKAATEVGLTGRLSINFMPNAVYEPSYCLQQTVLAAEKYRFDLSQVIFEFTEKETMRDIAHLIHIIRTYQQSGFLTAIDDFGAGYAGLGLLADVMPDIVKLDRHLVTGLDSDPVRRAIVRSVKALCDDLGILAVAEGIETAGEFHALSDIGITLVQGYYFARPQIGVLQTAMQHPLAATPAAQEI